MYEECSDHNVDYCLNRKFSSVGVKKATLGELK
jgi:hypothetical protein